MSDSINNLNNNIINNSAINQQGIGTQNINNPVPENLQDAKPGQAPVAEKQLQTQDPVALRSQIENIIVDDLQGKAAELARIATSALKANVDYSEVKANLNVALQDKTITQQDFDKLMQIVNLTVQERHTIADGKLPDIKNLTDFTDFVRMQANTDMVRGESAQIGTEKAENGNENKVFEFKGIVFRADNRSPEDIKRTGGFISQKDLRDPRNKLEAMGLGKNTWATDKSGVSCSDHLENAANYLTKKAGRLYIIDTSKLPQDENAYYMKDIILQNKLRDTDESGGEVNVTGIPTQAIIGWIEVGDNIISAPGEHKNSLIAQGIDSGRVKLEFNTEYGVVKPDSDKDEALYDIDDQYSIN